MKAISKHGWLNDLSDDELRELYRIMTSRRQQADADSSVDAVYNTNDSDYQDLYDALIFIMQSRGLL